MRWSTLLPLPFVALFGCSPPGTPGGSAGADDDDDDTTPADDDDATPCEYPADAAEEMAIGSVLWPYSWPTSSAPDRSDQPLDLARVFCNDDADNDWSPFDVLLFVSIPAW